MVVQNQKTWDNVDAPEDPQGSSASSSSSSSSWSFQAPAKTLPARPTSACNVQSRQPITRQIAINTLAAMHRRFSLPGPLQPHSRPIAEFRASANKSLDMLRQTVQSAVTREIDQVIKKYLEKFFVPAVNNIRHNLGEESVNEDQVRCVCRHMLDATRLLYTSPPRIVLPADNSDIKFPKMNFTFHTSSKRKDPDLDQDLNSPKLKKIKQEDGSEPMTPPFVPAYFDPKWNPSRLTPDTLFIMGSHAHKVLGLGSSRGRLYARHGGLPRYPADQDDKDWIANHNLANAPGGKTYIMVLEDIEELATSEAYRHSSLPMLGELTGFKVPPSMLKKIQDYFQKRYSLTGDLSNPQSPQPSTSDENGQNEEQNKFSVTANHIINNIAKSETKYENLSLMKDENDFDDIKVDGIKVEDIDDIKVEGIKEEELEEIKEEDLEGLKVDDIKVEDLDVGSIKVENIDDINEEDIKLENDDTLSVCKQTEDQDNLEGLLEADIEFLSKNLGNIESDADARKAIEKLTGANPDTMSLVGDEFDLGSTLNTNNFTESSTKCITVASTTSGLVHSVPVAHLAPRRAPGTLHYYTSAAPGRARPPRTVTIQTVPGSTSQVLRGIPINTTSTALSSLLSKGGGNIIGFARSAAGGGALLAPAHYVNVSPKTFPTGNILHNAIVSRNLVRTNPAPTTLAYSLAPPRQVNTTAAKNNDYDTISTTKDMIDNACNSSVMLKKVLTLGSAGVAKSFMMHNSQKILSTGYATGATPPPNVTIVSSGTSGGNVVNPNIVTSLSANTSLSATHATLSALLASTAENGKCRPN